MSFRAQAVADIPKQTATVARLAFPKGSVAMSLRDELGSLYEDEALRGLFLAGRGQPAWSAWRLALITVLQYIEDLSDAQAAQAVRGRIDWKYALSLELEDPGVDASVLSEFRGRLVESGCEELLLETLLERCKERGWLDGGEQRSDSTHVVAAIRVLHRLEVIGESLRAALNALAVVMPNWLTRVAEADWFERYGSRIEDYHFPKAKPKRQALAETMGTDGHLLLAALQHEDAPQWLRQLPAVECLRQVWVQQFYLDAQHKLHLRDKDDCPPSSKLIHSPYDDEARFSTKRQTHWVGYKVHLSETCGPDAPHLITDVKTTAATTADVKVTPEIHQTLEQRLLKPKTHITDTGYVSADQLLNAQAADVELLAPVLPDSSWQAQAQEGFGADHFEIDWDNQQARCPAGHLTSDWKPTTDRRGNPVIAARFAYSTCVACPHRPKCTRAKNHGRTVTLRPMAQHTALQKARQAQNTSAFKQRYAKRAGIEGTLSQAIRAFGLRRCRYIGLDKTHLQHVITATAINVVRLVNWSRGVPFALTRCSHFAALAPPTPV